MVWWTINFCNHDLLRQISDISRESQRMYHSKRYQDTRCGAVPPYENKKVQARYADRLYYYWYRLDIGWQWYVCRQRYGSGGGLFQRNGYIDRGILTFEAFASHEKEFISTNHQKISVPVDEWRCWMRQCFKRREFTFICICRLIPEFWLPRDIILKILDIGAYF